MRDISRCRVLSTWNQPLSAIGGTPARMYMTTGMAGPPFSFDRIIITAPRYNQQPASAAANAVNGLETASQACILALVLPTNSGHVHLVK